MQISLREFQRNATKYLDKLPITLTQYDKPVAIVQNIQNNQYTEITPTEPPTITLDQLKETVKELKEKMEWGNPKLSCDYCKTSPAMYFTYYDENSDPHQGKFCKKHIEMYEKEHGVKHYDYTPVKPIQTADLTAFVGAIPKPKKKEKK